MDEEPPFRGSVLVATSAPARLIGETASLPIEHLLPADSPRLQGEDLEHIRSLAEFTDELPPILVHRPTMRVIDGMHRLKAAILRGERTIEATFYDGDDAEAFVMAVKANVKHGLPLSLSDRKAAAARIVQSSPHWSDRAIAEVSGLSAKTVGAIRSDSLSEVPEVYHRIGRDGRVRPLSTVDGRRFASELITLNPESSSREIARKAGISPSTVRDVRDRLRRGEDPVPTRRRAGSHTERHTRERKLQEYIKAEQFPSLRCRDEILQNLSRDPAIRMTEHGRAMLRWLHSESKQVEKDWGSLATRLPDHCMCLVADLACSIAEAWLEFASEMRSRDALEQC
ncbi:ParB/RepB/Spo0J family partition protein [Actinoplanes nipponensis]|uniref:ParB/RepB/Spo0J family partition protein n=1 Tax=Actinoplanes nipponensis TaxID=135950 RepID=UPI0019458244|nr:ParB/RepB/Spo0J family partition protein [Actinoplanes nipponensis]